MPGSKDCNVPSSLDVNLNGAKREHEHGGEKVQKAGRDSSSRRLSCNGGSKAGRSQRMRSAGGSSVCF